MGACIGLRRGLAGRRGGAFREAPPGSREVFWALEPAPGDGVTEATASASLRRAAAEVEARQKLLLALDEALAAAPAAAASGAAPAPEERAIGAWRGSCGVSVVHGWAAGLLLPVELAAPAAAFAPTEPQAGDPCGGGGRASPGLEPDNASVGSGSAGRRSPSPTAFSSADAHSPLRRRLPGGSRASPTSSSPPPPAALPRSPRDAAPILGGDASSWPPRIPTASVASAALGACLREACSVTQYIRAAASLLSDLVRSAGGPAEAGGVDSQSLVGSGGRRFGPAHYAAAVVSGAATPWSRPAPGRLEADAAAGLSSREVGLWALLAAGVAVAPPTCNPPVSHIAAAAGVSPRLFECLVSAAAAEAEAAEASAAERRAQVEAQRDALAVTSGSAAHVLSAAASPAASRLASPARPVATWALPDATGLAGPPGIGERRFAGTALMEAAEAGREALVRWILETAPRAAGSLDAGGSGSVESGPFLPSPQRRGAAVPEQRVDLAPTGGARGVDVNAARPHSGRTALHLAAFNGHAGVVKLLLRAGADVGAEDHRGEAPLMSAVKGNQPAAVKALLLSGAAAPASEVLRPSADGETPLRVAERINVWAWTGLGGDARDAAAAGRGPGAASGAARTASPPQATDASSAALLVEAEPDPLGASESLRAVRAGLGKAPTQAAAAASDQVVLTLLRVAAMAGGAPEGDHLHECFRRGLTYGERAAAAAGGMARVKVLRDAVLKGTDGFPSLAVRERRSSLGDGPSQTGVKFAV